MRWSEVRVHVGDDSLLLVQDASPRVGKEASYQDGQHDEDRWTVVATCATGTTFEKSDKVEVALVPTAALSTDELKRVKTGSMADAASCQDFD